MPGQLAEMVRAKYPGAYDDLDDAALEQSVLSKYPEYADLAEPKAPDFRSSNATDEQGNALVRGVSSTWDALNTPLIPQIAEAAHAIAKHMDAPSLDRSKTVAQIRGFMAGVTEAGGNLAAGFTSPIGLAMTLAGLGPEGALASKVPALKGLLSIPQVRTLQKAVQATGGAGFAAHGASRAVTAPTTGEQLQGVAEMAAGVAGTANSVRPGVGRPARVGKLNPQEAAAVQFGQSRGVPLDAATATGSPTMRAAQKRVANSMGGEGTAERLIRQQEQALTRVGDDLVREAAPLPVTPEQAGEGIRGGVKGTIKARAADQDYAYGILRDIEADPQFSELVQTAPRGSVAHKRILGKLAAGLDDGRTPTEPELMVMRQIETELDAQPYHRGKLLADDPGVSSGTHYDPGSAGAPVYQEILQAAPGTAEMTRGAVLRSIQKTLATGNWTDAARGAYAVAQKRLRNSGWLGGPLLPSNTALLGSTERVSLPVELAPVKTALKPIYQRLVADNTVAPLQGGKAEALRALTRLMDGPDVVPVTVADAALGDLKTLARSAVPELRTQGQGVTAQAVKALHQAVQRAVERTGDSGAVQALETGRAATVAKAAARDLLKRFGERVEKEPVAIFRAVTAPKDSGIKLLRQVQAQAPDQVPQIGRAFLEQLMEKATAEGGFQRAAGLMRDWQNLGSETKRALFPKAGQVAALDHFFLLAKRIADNPNPSGTAHVNNVFNVLSQPGYWTVAKMLYTPLGVRALTRLLSSSAKAVTTPAAAQQAAQRASLVEVLAAARAAGVPLATPLAATGTPQEGRP